MKKVNILIIIILLALFINITIVKACDEVEKKQITKDASNIKISYVPNSEETKDPDMSQVIEQKNYLDIKIYNVPTTVYMELKSGSYSTQVDKVRLDYHNIGPDGSITLRMESLTDTANLSLEIYAFTNTCSGEKLKTITMKVPKFNTYSQLDVCNDIPEFYLCQEYIDFNIDKSKFYSQVEEYRKKKENPDTADLIIDDGATAQHNIYIEKKSYLKHIIFGVVTVIAVVGGYFLIKRKKHEPEIW